MQRRCTEVTSIEERRLIVRGLVGVSLVFFVLQIVIVPLGRWWSWDEAISVSQVTRGVVAADFDPWRFRGVSLLAAPPSLIGLPVVAVRVWLAVLASAALGLAYAAWIPTLRRAAPAAAAIFASSWMALLYGSEAMPNLWSALCGVAAMGSVLRTERPRLAIGALLFAAMALFRLPDALVLSLVVAVAALVRRRPAREVLVPLFGAAAGGLVWVVDVGLRFGLSNGLNIAIQSQRSQRLLTVTGPVRRLLAFSGWIGTNVPAPGFQPARWSIVSWGLVTGIAIFSASRRSSPVRLATVAAFALAIPYVAFVGPVVPRYLLPSLGLLAIGASAGVAEIASWMERVPGNLARGAITAIALGLLLANIAGASQAAEDVVEFRAVDRSVGEWVTRELGQPTRGSCTLLIVGNAPAVGMATPCRTRFFYPPGDAYGGQSHAYLRQAVEVAEVGGQAYIVRIWPGPPPEEVTLEPVAGSDVAELYRIVPAKG